jgi:hypothetical protein
MTLRWNIGFKPIDIGFNYVQDPYAQTDNNNENIFYCKPVKYDVDSIQQIKNNELFSSHYWPNNDITRPALDSSGRTSR